MKLYLVWNEAKTECVGLSDYAEAFYCINRFFPVGDHRVNLTALCEIWLDLHSDEQCTIIEIEV